MEAEDTISAIAAGWGLAPHTCRTCLSRILQDGDLFLCATCGAEAEGSPDAICGCGIRIKNLPPGRRPTTGFFCGPNPDRCHASPAEYVILFDGRPAQAPT